MAGNAFTAGVKPGGLTTSTEIRILLCYLIQHAGTPLSQGELETALLGEELVNYFELASNLSNLLEQGFVREENGRYTILPAGADIAEALADDVPRSVRDAAVRATLAAQQFARKEAQHHAQIDRPGDDRAPAAAARAARLPKPRRKARACAAERFHARSREYRPQRAGQAPGATA